MRTIATTLDIVRACEQAEAAHLDRQVAALATIAPQLLPIALPISGGCAALTSAAYGRKLNHVSGAFLDDPPTAEQLSRLNEAYRARGTPCEIDVCPHCEPRTLDVLSRAGFVVNAFSNTYRRDLPVATSSSPVPIRARVRTLESSDHDAFVDASVRGFVAQPKPRPVELLEVLARVATLRADTTLYAAEIDGNLVGSAALAILPTQLGPVALLHLTSTLPAFRGHGAQAALLEHRLCEAQRLGAVLATLCARPGTNSARNAERCGFALAYTKPTFRSPP